MPRFREGDIVLLRGTIRFDQNYDDRVHVRIGDQPTMVDPSFIIMDTPKLKPGDEVVVNEDEESRGKVVAVHGDQAWIDYSSRLTDAIEPVAALTRVDPDEPPAEAERLVPRDPPPVTPLVTPPFVPEPPWRGSTRDMAAASEVIVDGVVVKSTYADGMPAPAPAADEVNIPF